MSEVLQTQEVGSLPKPDWRVAIIGNQGLTDKAQLQAFIENWLIHEGGPKLPHIVERALDDYEHTGGYSDYTKQLARIAAVGQTVRLQERAGLDIIYDGEQNRSEMYEHCVRRTRGFESRGRVRVFDNKTFHKFAVTGVPGLDKPWHADEIEEIKVCTDKTIKIPITGPYTIADWSYDEYFGGDREAFLSTLSENVISPNIESILSQGVDWVQIDEPAAGTKHLEIPQFVESFNTATAGLLGRFSIHLCYSDWTAFIPHIAELKNCHQLSIEFANRDSQRLGTSADDRPAYEVLKDIHRELPKTAIGLGVVTVHDDIIESPELVRDRVLRAVDLVGDPSLIYPSPDCGLRTRSRSVAAKKLRSVVLGTELAKQELGV